MVRHAEWSSEDALWTVEAEHDGARVVFTCGFLLMCSGYYDYAQGHNPQFAKALRISPAALFIPSIGRPIWITRASRWW